MQRCRVLSQKNGQMLLLSLAEGTTAGGGDESYLGAVNWIKGRKCNEWRKGKPIRQISQQSAQKVPLTPIPSARSFSSFTIGCISAELLNLSELVTLSPLKRCQQSNMGGDFPTRPLFDPLYLSKLAASTKTF